MMSPIRAHSMRSMPLPQMLRMAIDARVVPATHHSAALTGSAVGPSIERRPETAADKPIITMMRPDISGGKIARSRLSSGASAVSRTPASTVMPKTSGAPPTFAARSEGTK
jgi:hypothetical protein